MLDPLADRLERFLDVLSVRQNLVAANIANADTPGYKTKDVDFQSTLESLLDGRDRPAGVEVQGLKPNNDGNNVNLDREARLLAENAMRFSLASNLLRSQIRTVKEAIQEGKNG
jgi:flagellar basal-body rod protein FlgB